MGSDLYMNPPKPIKDTIITGDKQSAVEWIERLTEQQRRFTVSFDGKGNMVIEVDTGRSL